jgi:hypothetical protein
MNSLFFLQQRSIVRVVGQSLRTVATSTETQRRPGHLPELGNYILYYWVARAWQAFTATFAKKPRSFSKLSRPPIKKFATAWSTTTIQNKKHNVWGGILLFFFISALHFWIKHYTKFLNRTKFVSQHLIAAHGHFHRYQFLTANYFLIQPVLSYLAVATATWQHWFIMYLHKWHCDRSRCNESWPSQGQMYFVFCRLYLSSPQPVRHCLTPVSHLFSLN